MEIDAVRLKIRKVVQHKSTALWVLRLLIVATFVAIGFWLFGQRAETVFDGSAVRSVHGNMYVTPLKTNNLFLEMENDSNSDPIASKARLYEGRSELGPPHSQHADIAALGSGRYSHWQDKLYFSASDNSDPRTNGRSYRLTYRVYLEPWIPTLLTLASAIGFLILKTWRIKEALWVSRLLVVAAHFLLLRPLPALVEMLKNMRAETIDLVRCVWTFLPIALAFSLFLAPVIWSVDSQVICGYPLAGLIPHFPPLYPLLTRGVASFIVLLHGELPDFNHSIFGSGAARLMLLIQHGFTILAAGRLAMQLTNSRFGARLITAILYLNPVTLLYVHSLATEALVVPALFAAAAEAILVAREKQYRLRRLAPFFAWSAMAALTRHAAIFVVFILPSLSIFYFLFLGSRANARTSCLALGKGVILNGLGVISVIIVTIAVENLVMTLDGTEHRSILGRAFVYRIAPGGVPGFGGSLFDDDAERRAAVSRLMARAPNTTIRHTLSIMASTPNPWVGPFHRIFEEVHANCHGCSAEHESAKVDRMMNDAALYAIMSLDPSLVKDTLLRVVDMLAPVRAWSYTQCCGSIVLRGPNWHIGPRIDLNAKVAPIATFDGNGIRNSFPAKLDENVGIILSLNNWLRAYLFVFALPVILIGAFSCLELGAIVFSLSTATLAYCLIVSITTVYIARYGVFVDLIYIIMGTIVCARRSSAYFTRVQMSERGQTAA